MIHEEMTLDQGRGNQSLCQTVEPDTSACRTDTKTESFRRGTSEKQHRKTIAIT